MLSGAGMSLLHFSEYGYTLHFPTAIDHGVVGVILVIIGAFLGAGRPGKRAKKPGTEE